MSGPPVVTGLYDGAVVLLAAAGAAKVARPSDTATALRGVGLPVTATVVRVAAALEVALAALALTVAGPWPAAAVAASYAGFCAFVTVALVRRLPLATCGCFGRPDTPPSPTHVAVDAVAAVAAIAWAVTGDAAPVTATSPHPELAFGALVAAALAAAVLTNPLAKA